MRLWGWTGFFLSFQALAPPPSPTDTHWFGAHQSPHAGGNLPDRTVHTKVMELKSFTLTRSLCLIKEDWKGMISTGGISDPLILGREERTFWVRKWPPLRSSLPPWGADSEGRWWWNLPEAHGQTFFFLSAYVRFCLLFSLESAVIIRQRKSAWRIFIHWWTKDVIPSYTFFYTKLILFYHYKVIWLYDKS